MGQAQQDYSAARQQAREAALKFLYQCEMDKIYFFSESHFNSFMSYFGIDEHAAQFAKTLIELSFSNLPAIDQLIQDHARNWSIARMGVIDRSILRLAVAELSYATTPYKVVINEAIELGKQYGTGESPAFVNGILDAISVKLKKN